MSFSGYSNNSYQGSSSKDSSGLSCKPNLPSYPGDSGGVTCTYTTRDYPSSSGNYAFSGSASVFG